MKPLTVTTDTLHDGSLAVEVRCSCLAVRGALTPWEARGPLLARLGAEHRCRAPLCRHRGAVACPSEGHRHETGALVWPAPARGQRA